MATCFQYTPTLVPEMTSTGCGPSMMFALCAKLSVGSRCRSGRAVTDDPCARIHAGLYVCGECRTISRMRVGELAQPVPVTLRAAPVVRAPVVSDDSAQELATVTARPLLNPSRRSAVAAVAPGIEMPRLTGIIINHGASSAIFAPADNAKPFMVKEGDTLGEWSVRSITTGSVILASSSGTHVLHPSSTTIGPDLGRAAAARQRTATAGWVGKR
jgi:hypothetical protein